MTTTRTDRCAPLALVVMTLSTSPAMADAQKDEQRASDIADSSAERMPAVTTFPKYPVVAQRDRIEGEATVCFKIAPNGRILDPSVESSTHRIFEKPSLQAIRESSFEPLSPGEKVSATRTCRTYRFRLDPVASGNEE